MLSFKGGNVMEVQAINKPRVVLLYRASSKKQTDSENDIPLQRNILKPWAERQGWNFVKEFVEGGISGYKVSAANRDALIEIKKMAERREFDILGIYMSDRLGRIADETPLIVSFLNKRNIKVISYSEGEINSANHTDKLMTYIRYWQAEGESLKTSMRVTDAGVTSVKAGKWRGGNAPYGYRHVSRGTLNYKGKPIFDVEIHPEQAEVVRTIFRLYKDDRYGGLGIARYLNDRDIPTKEGGLWNQSLITKILKNKLYTGIYELGKWKKDREIIASPVMEHLVIISQKDFNDAMAIRRLRNPNPNRKPPTRRGSLMLTGLLYCGECDGKFTSTHFKQKKQRKSGETWEYSRKTYRCDSFRTPRKERPKCEHKIFTAEDLEELIVTDVKNFLSTTDKEKLLTSHDDQIQEQAQEIADRLKRTVKEITQKEKEVTKLKDEVLKVIMGNSQFSQSLLSELIQTKEMEIVELRKKQTAAQAAADDIEKTLSSRRVVAESLDTWADRFDAQDTMSKKSMLINLIERATVYEQHIEAVYQIKLDGIIGGDTDGGDTSLVSPIFYAQNEEKPSETSDISNELMENSQKGLYKCIDKQLN